MMGFLDGLVAALRYIVLGTGRRHLVAQGSPLIVSDVEEEIDIEGASSRAIGPDRSSPFAARRDRFPEERDDF